MHAILKLLKTILKLVQICNSSQNVEDIIINIDKSRLDYEFKDPRFTTKTQAHATFLVVTAKCTFWPVLLTLALMRLSFLAGGFDQ